MQLLLCALLAGTVSAPGVRAETEVAQTRAGDESASRRSDGRRTFGRLPANLLRGAAGVFARDSVGPLLVGTGATVLGSAFDDDMADWIADPDHDFGKSFEDGASPTTVGLALGGLFLGGRLAKGQGFRDLSYDLLDAFLVNLAYTEALKRVVSRERPNGEDDLSFPSGHTSNAFALAAVADGHYGWKVAVPAYTLASVVGISRLQRNKHHLSDVLAGATLGYVVGRAVVRVNEAPVPGMAGAEVSVTPLLGGATRGLVVGIAF